MTPWLPDPRVIWQISLTSYIGDGWWAEVWGWWPGPWPMTNDSGIISWEFLKTRTFYDAVLLLKALGCSEVPKQAKNSPIPFCCKHTVFSHDVYINTTCLLASWQYTRPGYCCDRVRMDGTQASWARPGIMSHYVTLETITQALSLYSRADGKMIPSPDDSLGFSPAWSHSSKLI